MGGIASQFNSTNLEYYLIKLSMILLAICMLHRRLAMSRDEHRRNFREYECRTFLKSELFKLKSFLTSEHL